MRVILLIIMLGLGLGVRAQHSDRNNKVLAESLRLTDSQLESLKDIMKSYRDSVIFISSQAKVGNNERRKHLTRLSLWKQMRLDSLLTREQLSKLKSYYASSAQSFKELAIGHRNRN